MKESLFIGTSGWGYSHWEGIFYPKGISPKEKLRYFSNHFKTTEINYSFYHLPRAKTYQNWYSETPPNFLFAVKASRFITHIKRLKEVEKHFKTFLENALYLKEKLGPILFQFPPSFKAGNEDLERLENFLKRNKEKRLRFAFEFRNISFCDRNIYNLLRRYNAAWVIADSPSYPRTDVITSDFAYIRLHGSKILFSSKYTDKELEELAYKIKMWFSDGIFVYVYFNNDYKGFAVENAKRLMEFLE